MAKEICISSTPHETRLAILEDDQLAEIYYERENEYTLAGSIYNGRVTRVLPGMQSAFVDLGLERDAFLYVTDFIELEDQEETDELERAAASGGDRLRAKSRHPHGGDRNGRGTAGSEDEAAAIRARMASEDRKSHQEYRREPRSTAERHQSRRFCRIGHARQSGRRHRSARRAWANAAGVAGGAGAAAAGPRKRPIGQAAAEESRTTGR